VSSLFQKLSIQYVSKNDSSDWWNKNNELDLMKIPYIFFFKVALHDKDFVIQNSPVVGCRFWILFPYLLGNAFLKLSLNFSYFETIQ